MKLIQENNTLYIIEGENKYKVSEESISKLKTLAFKLYVKQGGYGYNTIFELESVGIDITDIEHRIDIVKKYAQQQDSEVEIEYYEAVLLPEKEVNSTMVNGTPQWLTDPTKIKAIVTFGNANLVPIDNTQYHQHIIKLYSIEQIEMAIDQMVLEGYQIEIIKQEIVNNLTK